MKVQKSQFSISNIVEYSKVLIILDQLDKEYRENEIDYQVEVFYKFPDGGYRIQVIVYEET